MRQYYTDRSGYIRSRSIIEPTREPIVRDFVHSNGLIVQIKTPMQDPDVEELIVPKEEHV